jgi:hypothetical protein
VAEDHQLLHHFLQLRARKLSRQQDGINISEELRPAPPGTDSAGLKPLQVLTTGLVTDLVLIFRYSIDNGEVLAH